MLTFICQDVYRNNNSSSKHLCNAKYGRMAVWNLDDDGGAVDGQDDGACVDDGHDENGGRGEDYLSSIITMLSSLLSTNMTVAQLLWSTIYLYLYFGTVAKHIMTSSHPCISP